MLIYRSVFIGIILIYRSVDFCRSYEVDPNTEPLFLRLVLVLPDPVIVSRKSVDRADIETKTISSPAASVWHDTTDSTSLAGQSSSLELKRVKHASLPAKLAPRTCQVRPWSLRDFLVVR